METKINSRIDDNTIDDFEKVFRNNSYNGDLNSESNFEVVKGLNNIMVSAPHAVKHFRNNGIKLQEFMTGALVKLAIIKAGCHGIYSTKYTENDPNWDDSSEYRNQLINHINSNNISLFFDIHGTIYNNYDLILGINNYKNVSSNKMYIKIIVDFFKNCGYRVGLDKQFKASFKNNICKVVHEKTEAYAVQIEISQSIRKNKENFKKFANDFYKFIQLMEQFFIISKKEKSNYSEFWWPLNYIGISNKTARLYNLKEGDTINYTLMDVEDSCSFQILIDDKNFKEYNTFYFSNKYLKIVSKYKLFRKISTYKINKLLKPFAEDASNDFVFLSEKLYNQFKMSKCTFLKVSNNTLKIYANLKFKMYSDEHQSNSNTIWLCHNLRSLLGLELAERYHWDQYDKILKILQIKYDQLEKLKPNSLKKVDIQNLLLFMQYCYIPDESGKTYELVAKPINRLREMAPNIGLDIDMDIIRRKYRSIFDVSINAYNVIHSSKINILFDKLIGYSSTQLISSRIHQYYEGINCVKINNDVALTLDVVNNERVILYHNGKKISCRVIIDSTIDSFSIQIPKVVRAHLKLNDSRTLIYVKRDNTHIFLKKVDSLILSLALTSFTVISFFEKIFESNQVIYLIIICSLIWMLIITSTYNERRSNVKSTRFKKGKK